MKEGNKMNLQDLQRLELHEEINIDYSTKVMRVPGGWIYKFYEYDFNKDVVFLSTTTFVPEAINIEAKLTNRGEFSS